MSIRPLIFLAGYGAGLGATLFIGPFYGLLTYLFTYYNHPPMNWWRSQVPDLRYSLLVSLITLISLLLHWKKFKERKIFDTPQNKWLLLLFLLMLAIHPNAVDQELSMKYIIIFFKLLIFYLLVYKVIRTEREFDIFIWFHLLGCFNFGLQAYENPKRRAGRLYGIGGPDTLNDNHLAGLLATAVPFIAYYLFYGKKWERLLAFAIAPFILNGIILANSRGATIGLMAGGLTWVCLVFREKMPHLRWKTVLSTVGAAVLFVSLMDPVFLERFSTIRDPSDEGAGKNRIPIWLSAVDMVRDNPLGSGGGSFERLSSNYVPVELLGQHSGEKNAHSTYVLLAVEQGGVGLLLFLLFVGSSLWGLHRWRARLRADPGAITLRARSMALEAALVSLLVGGITLTRLYGESLYWFCGLAAVLYQIMKKYSESDQPKAE